jgi:hypothetical protein
VGGVEAEGAAVLVEDVVVVAYRGLCPLEVRRFAGEADLAGLCLDTLRSLIPLLLLVHSALLQHEQRLLELVGHCIAFCAKLADALLQLRVCLLLADCAAYCGVAG